MFLMFDYSCVSFTDIFDLLLIYDIVEILSDIYTLPLKFMEVIHNFFYLQQIVQTALSNRNVFETFTLWEQYI